MSATRLTNAIAFTKSSNSKRRTSRVPFSSRRHSGLPARRPGQPAVDAEGEEDQGGARGGEDRPRRPDADVETQRDERQRGAHDSRVEREAAPRSDPPAEEEEREGARGDRRQSADR